MRTEASIERGTSEMREKTRLFMVAVDDPVGDKPDS